MEVTINGVRYVPVTHDEVMLSVLVPSVSARRSTFAPKLMEQLFTQHEKLSPADRSRVEILFVTDTGRDGGMVVGDKRNAMLRMARGKYVSFVDDDDRVSDDYLSTLLRATDADADCITFIASVSVNNGPRKPCFYSASFSKDENEANRYKRIPNHLCAVKRVHALSTSFVSKQFGEDAEYAVRLKPLLKTEEYIDRTLYFYDYSDTTTETQGARGQRPQLVAVPTQDVDVVDVVILSKATTPELQLMCQNAIDTCSEGAGQRGVNITVIEQISTAKYHGVNVVYETGDFNYNKFANIGARLGKAPWIMVANSDLVFENGWLDALLIPNHACVSPVDPLRRNQRSVRHDEAGWVNGHHFSGWCFMVRRELWEKIGGFDDCVSYWCSDNVVIEQLRAVGVMPRLVHGARVKHLGSQTAPKPPDDQTWEQVRIFNKKYPQRPLFLNDPRFVTYCKKNGIAA